METAVTILLAVLGSGAFTAIVNQVCNNINKKKENDSGERAALKILLDDRLNHLCKNHLMAGAIDADDRRRVIEMYDAYHRLGGNGYFTDLIDQVKRLPLK